MLYDSVPAENQKEIISELDSRIEALNLMRENSPEKYRDILALSVCGIMLRRKPYRCRKDIREFCKWVKDNMTFWRTEFSHGVECKVFYCGDDYFSIEVYEETKA